MFTALDAPPGSLDDAERAFVANIRAHGWFRTGVPGDDEGPGFSFTTGFWISANHPELIIFNTRNDIAHDVFWDVFHDARRGTAVPVGKRTEAVFANLPAFAFPVAKKHYGEFLGWSRCFYGGDHFPCLQIVWPDRAGRFPWEAEFDPEFAADQPDLSEGGWLNEIVG